MKILVLGSSGQLGKCLANTIDTDFYDVTFASRSDFDITDFSIIRQNIRNLNPDVIINAAAYTFVDNAEQQSELADLVNNKAVENIAGICKDLDCGLIHVSTDYVFDGLLDRPYSEQELTNPQSVYGESKLKGERAIERSGCSYLIVRTAWVFSAFGSNFFNTMLRLADTKDTLNIVNDQIGSPTYAPDLAAAIIKTLPYFKKLNLRDIYHYAGYPPCSWADFAKKIFSEAESLSKIEVSPVIKEISSKDFPTPAKRPMNSILDSTRFEARFGCKASNWTAGIRSALSIY